MSKQSPEQVLQFATQKEWRRWLAKYHAACDGMWLRIFKKGANKPTVTYDQALDEALCYGWIDGLKKSHDVESFIQRFTPRRPRSLWSIRNKTHVARLIKAGKMKPSGLKQIEAAKADGRWKHAYDSPKNMLVPEDFLKELAKDKKALGFFKELNKANTYAIAWRLQTATKPEIRERRMKSLLAMLAQQQKLH
jgi:uncharacterized protein YdeI (YjbR/CyaY-like superfamily)